MRLAADRDAHVAPRRECYPAGHDFRGHAAGADVGRRTTGHRLDRGRDPRDLRDELRIRIDGRVGRVETVDVGQQHQAVRTRHLRDTGGETVVVAVADLGRGDRVVLVDDRDRAELEQRLQRVARVQVPPPLLGVAEGEQHLRNGQVVLLEHFLPGVREPDLPDRRRGLALLQSQATRRQPELPPPQRDRAGRHEDDLLAPFAQCREVRGQRLEPGAIQATRGAVDEQRRADLDHDPPRPGQA